VLRVRLAGDDGFGLVELLIAMTILVTGITAIVAGFSSGIVALQRSSQVSTAGVLADQQMESYRRVRFAAIALDTTLFAAATSGGNPTYTGDTAYPPSPPGTITGSANVSAKLWEIGLACAAVGTSTNNSASKDRRRRIFTP